GVYCSDVTQSVADSYGMPLGLYVRNVVEGSAAEAAGLQKGDVITAFAGRSVGSQKELDEALQSCQAGQQVEITYQRQVNGEYRENTVTVTLGSKN
ncbi:MAG: PDZ domain-containing protein, partial [Lachnospiraceae bacterium]|nr:PDZ domain-containing protein [Lachnospiraceae bacterium]